METKKACRLYRDLGVNWAISLLDEMEQLKKENKLLQCRLNRFILD
jgi:hypothetical protein